jgi:hypothetical protein
MLSQSDLKEKRPKLIKLEKRAIKTNTNEI